MSTADFPKRLPQKLKTIRERGGLTPDEIAPKENLLHDERDLGAPQLAVPQAIEQL